MPTLFRWTLHHRSAVLLICALALAASLAVNVRLAFKRRPTFIDLSQTFVPGEQFPSVRGQTLDGLPATIDVVPTIVYIFSSKCAWCDTDYANLAAIERHVSQYRVLALTVDTDLEALNVYLRSHPVKGEVVIVDTTRMDRATARVFGVTPQWVIVDQRGLVERRWVGALYDERQREVETFLQIALPGATIPRPAVARSP